MNILSTVSIFLLAAILKFLDGEVNFNLLQHFSTVVLVTITLLMTVELIYIESIKTTEHRGHREVSKMISKDTAFRNLRIEVLYLLGALALAKILSPDPDSADLLLFKTSLMAISSVGALWAMVEYSVYSGKNYTWPGDDNDKGGYV